MTTLILIWLAFKDLNVKRKIQKCKNGRKIQASSSEQQNYSQQRNTWKKISSDQRNKVYNV